MSCMGSIEIIIAAAVVLIGFVVVRLSVCLPCFRRKRRRHHVGSPPVKTMIVLGSGGHTSEMAMLVRSLPLERYHPVHCVLAASDTTSLSRLNSSVDVPILSKALCHTILRSREVKQSWISTVFTSLHALFEALLLVNSIKPELILCNGPGELKFAMPKSCMTVT